jgi:CHAT domain-containing protein
MILLPLVLATTLQEAPFSSRPTDRPGPDAGAAFLSIEAGRKQEGCARLLSQIRAGTQDPWAFAGAFLEGCFSSEANFGDDFKKSLESRPADDPLVVFGRAIWHSSRSEYFNAGELLRLVVAKKPELALGWYLLGDTLMGQADYGASVAMFDKALSLSPELQVARNLRQRAQMFVGALDRLEALLATIPERWSTIPPARVPVSGRRRLEVLNVSQEELSRSLASFQKLLQSPPEARAQKIRERSENPAPTELDLWVLGWLSETQINGKFGLEMNAVLVEAWLQWSEALGRRDVLLYAATLGIHLLERHAPPAAPLSIVRAWALLLPRPRSEADEPFYSGLQESYARALLHDRLPDEALPVLRDLRAWHEKRGDSGLPIVAGTWLGEGDCLNLRQEYDKALRAYGRARDLAKAAGDRDLQGSAILAEARIRFNLLDNDKALAAFREARPLLEAAGNASGQGEAWVGEGEMLRRLGKHNDALSAYAKARPFLEAAHDQQGLGDILFGEAEISRLRGDNETALHDYRQARDCFTAAADDVGLGKAWLGEAGVRGELGDSEVALQMLEKARLHSEKGHDQIGVGTSWLDEGDLRQWLKEYDLALDAYRKARRNFAATGDRMGQAHTWIGEGEILHLRQAPDDQGALTAYRQALELAPDEPRSRGSAALGEAKILDRHGQYRQAAEKAASAADHFLRDPAYLPGRLEALLLEQHDLQELGLLDQAAPVAEEAVRVHATWRKTRVTDSHRTQADLMIARAYDLLVPLRVEEGRMEEALTRAEEARSRVLLDLLSSGPPRAATSAPDLTAEQQRLAKEEAAVEEKLADTADSHQREELLGRRASLDREREWNAYERAAKDSPMVTSTPLDAGAIEALARETGPILLYYSAADEVVGFLILPQGPQLRVERIDLPWWGLRREVQAFAFDLANPLFEQRAQRRARELWDRLIAPFADHLPTGGNLVLVPHGPLHELPFEALRDPTDKLVSARWQISVVPSVSALAVARRRHRESQPGDSILAFASGRGLLLPESEVAEVAGLFKESPLIAGPAASGLEAYRKAMSTRQVFIATRGVHVADSRMGTYLEIVPTQGVHDSRMSAAEIATIPVEAELVTLAACDTASGEALFSDERLDLSRAFLIAGAASVLATRWKVPEDAATSHFVADFYRAYRQGGTSGKGLRKDEALSLARVLSRERGDPAQLWAAWVLVGDPR